MADIRIAFGLQMKKLRLDRHLTQEDLADRTDLHSTYIGQIERGLRNPSLVNIHKLARALKVKGGELLPF